MEPLCPFESFLITIFQLAKLTSILFTIDLQPYAYKSAYGFDGGHKANIREGDTTWIGVE